MSPTRDRLWSLSLATTSRSRNRTAAKPSVERRAHRVRPPPRKRGRARVERSRTHRRSPRRPKYKRLRPTRKEHRRPQKRQREKPRRAAVVRVRPLRQTTWSERLKRLRFVRNSGDSYIPPRRCKCLDVSAWKTCASNTKPLLVTGGGSAVTTSLCNHQR